MSLTAVHPPVGAARARGLRGWTARRPLTAFLVLAFAGIYPMMSLPILASHGLIPGGALLDRLPMSPDELAGLLLTLAGLLPATLYVTWATEGREGLLRLWSRIRRWRVGVGWWLLVVAGMPVLTVAIGMLLGDSWKAVDVVPFVIGQAGLLAANFFLVNLWEETAWAGFLQGDARGLAMPLAVVVLTAVTAVVVRHRLTRAYRAQLDALPGGTHPSLLFGRTPR